MPLSHFLGETLEIMIIDFLMENMDMGYSIDEISTCTTLSTKEVSDAMRILIANEGVGKIETGKYKGYYTVKHNEIVDSLLDAVYTHSFAMALAKRRCDYGDRV